MTIMCGQETRVLLVFGLTRNFDLTTKLTKATKNSYEKSLNLRALRVLRGEKYLFYVGCGYAALGPRCLCGAST
jgi:hypothetical protein